MAKMKDMKKSRREEEREREQNRTEGMTVKEEKKGNAFQRHVHLKNTIPCS